MGRPEPVGRADEREDAVGLGGWNSWVTAGCAVDEDDVLAAAEALISTGLRDAGLRYLTIDDGWSEGQRDRHGELRPDPDRFPRGLGRLAGDLHARGLRLGLYASATRRTCAQRRGTRAGATGSWGFERRDAASFAAWGVDLVKYDWCSRWGGLAEQRLTFARMRAALRAADDSIVFCINPNSHHMGGNGFRYDWDGIADWWRTTQNVAPVWQRASRDPLDDVGVLDVLDTHRRRGELGLTRGAVDADHIPVGYADGDGNRLSEIEECSAIGLWALLGAPLWLCADLASLPSRILTLLTGPDLRRVAGRSEAQGPAQRVLDLGEGCELWLRGSRRSSRTACLVNRADAPRLLDDSEVAAAATLVGPGAWREVGGENGAGGHVSEVLAGGLPGHGVRLVEVRGEAPPRRGRGAPHRLASGLGRMGDRR